MEPKKKNRKSSNKEKTSSKDWLEMDLKAQSGAIWTDEKSNNLQKEKGYQPPKDQAGILAPDPVQYGGKEFPDESQIL